METDKRLETLEGEFKLIKGELKETLANVRDYLMEIKLPSSQKKLAEDLLFGNEEQSINIKGAIAHAAGGVIPQQPASLSAASPESPPAPTASNFRSPEPQATRSPEPRATRSPEPRATRSPEPRATRLPSREPFSQPMETEEIFAPQPEMLAPGNNYKEPEILGDKEAPERDSGNKVREEVSQSTPGVNLLANLIRWVASAKNEIGYEKLPIFLEVYGISGHLSPELKEVILHLAEITEQEAADGNTADIWRRLTLELHGILSGSDEPLYSLKPFWNEAESEVQMEESEAGEEKKENKPLKLKLVLSSGNDEDKVFSIDLDPERDGGSLEAHPQRKQT